jgi:hypothetical protein
LKHEYQEKALHEFRHHSGDGSGAAGDQPDGVHREHETKAAAQRSIDMTEATSSVRFQMMQNRLHLQNYLLSGDTRDVEKMNDGEHQLSDALHHAQELANSEQQRGSLEKVQGLEQAWGNEFANPLVDKRRAVDSGNATVAELQIFYLQKDPNSWVSHSSDVLDDVDRENRKLLDERRTPMKWRPPGRFWRRSSVPCSRWPGRHHCLPHGHRNHRTARPLDSRGGPDRPVRRSRAHHRRSRQG